MSDRTATEAWIVGSGSDRGAGILGPVIGSLRYQSAAADWQPTDAAGFWIKPLFEDRERGEKTLLMKVDPGAFSPMHNHPGELEQIFVLEGSFYDQDAVMGPGSYCCRAPDAGHEAGSKEGAVVLLVYTRR